MTDIEVMRHAVEVQGDVQALLGYADELNMAGHPLGEKLSEYAVLANTTECMATAAVAVACFFETAKKSK